MTVSPRAARLVGSPSPLVVAHFACARDPYDAATNPDGYVNFGTAQSELLWDLVAPRLRKSGLDEVDTHYGELHGTRAFREAAARALAHVAGAPVDAAHLVVASGASAVLDMLAFTLCEPGEGILVPAPYYSGFEVDLTSRAGARIVPAPLTSADGFALRVDALEEALSRARAEGVTVRAVLITSPYNPLGRTHAPETLRDVLAFARREGLHAVFDEIYAGSVFGDRPFTSALALAGEGPPEGVHVVYGFAKDFGLSGFKVGVLHTRDPEVLAACQELAYLAPVSTGTQRMLVDALADDAWLAGLRHENAKRLAASYAHVAAALARAGIEHVRADAGVFVWLDLRRALSAPTREGERALREHVFAKAKVNITPGAAFACAEPGWFRLCYAQDPDTVRVGIERLARALA